MSKTETKEFTLSCCFDVEFKMPQELFEEVVGYLLDDLSVYDEEEDLSKVNELKELDKTFKQDPVKVFKLLSAMAYKSGLKELLEGEFDNEVRTLTKLFTVVEETTKDVA